VRCTRCDRIAIPQAVGRTPDDRLVFGWCPDCLADAGCRIEFDLPMAGPLAHPRPATAPRRPLRRRWRRLRDAGRRLRRDLAAADRRRLLLAVVGAGLTIWSLALAVAGGIMLARAGLGPRAGMAAPLLAGAGLSALLALLTWTLAGPRRGGLVVWLRVGQVAAATVTFGALAWAIWTRDPRRYPVLILAALAGLGASGAARWTERRLRRSPPVRSGRRVA